MLFNGRALIFTFSGTQVRIAEHERLQSLFKMSMVQVDVTFPGLPRPGRIPRHASPARKHALRLLATDLRPQGAASGTA